MLRREKLNKDIFIRYVRSYKDKHMTKKEHRKNYF